MDAVYQNASVKAARHLIPFLILCYVVAYLDRVNAGFAALTMNKELGLTVPPSILLRADEQIE